MRVLIRAKDPVKMTDVKLGMVPIDLADVLHRYVSRGGEERSPAASFLCC